VGKRIEDLKLDDTPIEQRVEAPESVSDDLRDQPWYQFVAEIDELLDDEAYAWAATSLEGIAETVGKTRRVTEGQQRAVRNIRDGRRESRRPFARRWGW
jgi:heat shock protein HspQ